MPRIRPLFVTAIILSTLAACGQRPAFKKADDSLANGVFEDEKVTKEDAATPYETSTYAKFSIANGQLFFDSMSADGTRAKILVGTVTKTKGHAFKLTVDSAIGTSSSNAIVDGLIKWIGGKDVQLFTHDGKLTLKNGANQVRHYTLTTESKAEDAQKAIEKKIGDRKEAEAKFMELMKGKTLVLQRKEIDSWQRDPKQPADEVNAAADVDASDVFKALEQKRTTQSVSSNQLPAVSKSDENAKVVQKRAKAVVNAPTTPRFQPRIVHNRKAEKDIPPEKKDEKSGKLVVNIKRLRLIEENGQTYALINEKHKATMKFHLMKQRYAEKVKDSQNHDDFKKLAVVFEIIDLNAEKYDVEKTRARLNGVVFEVSDDEENQGVTVLKLVSRDLKERRVVTTQFFKVVDSSSPEAAMPKETAVTTEKPIASPAPAKPDPKAPVKPEVSPVAPAKPEVAPAPAPEVGDDQE